MKLSIAALLLTFGVGVANASVNAGQVITIRSNLTSAGNTRVSLLVSGNGTSCSQNGWYSFEYLEGNGTAGIGKVWVATLLAALNSGRTVTINGLGTCDQFGLEQISFIDAN